MKPRILVVEDERPIREGLVDLLEGEGYTVDTAADGPEALRRYGGVKPDLVLLDIMIPQKSGLDVCREIRRADAATPILMLTAKGEEIDKVVGLELGADDYIVKPFGVRELLARVRAALRRAREAAGGGAADPDAAGVLAFGGVRIDPRTLTGSRGGREFPLTPREVALLRLFLERDGQVVDRATLLDRVWGVRYEGTTRTLDQHVAKLRRKIEADPARPLHLTTVHGVGYRFSARGGAPPAG